jgi:hypothetical protein
MASYRGRRSAETAEDLELSNRKLQQRGHDWTDRYPAIAAAAGKLRARSFTMDGEAVVVGVDGVAVFDALHRWQRHRGDPVRVRDLPSASARRSWRGCWRGSPPASSSTSTPTRTIGPCALRFSNCPRFFGDRPRRLRQRSAGWLEPPRGRRAPHSFRPEGPFPCLTRRRAWRAISRASARPTV